MFEKAGMDMDDAENIVNVEDHVGPHPPEYHRFVLRYLEGRTEGLTEEEYSNAFQAGLKELAEQIRTPGSKLNELLTTRWKP